MNKKLSAAEVLKEAAILTAAVAIIAAAVYFFLVPSHTSVSSISGLGIVLSNFVPLPLSTITMILNVILLLIGFLTCGREFGAKTVYTSVMLPVFLGLFERLFPDFASLTGSQTLDVLCYILVVSIGLSILFNRNASSGGLDIVAKILNKYLRIELGRAMSLAGMCVALSAALVYAASVLTANANRQLLEQEGIGIGDLDWIVCHQANARIIDLAAKKYHIPPEKYYKNIQKYGNTSAASIPLVISELHDLGKVGPGSRVLVVGFGGGLTWGGALVEFA